MSHRGVPHPTPVAPQPLLLSLTHLPVIVAEIRTQGVEVQGEPQSTAHQLCNHLSTAFPPAWLPARAQQRQQKNRSINPHLPPPSPPDCTFPRASPPASSSSLRSFFRSPAPQGAGLRCSCVFPGFAGSQRSPHARQPREASGDRLHAPRRRIGAIPFSRGSRSPP